MAYVSIAFGERNNTIHVQIRNSSDIPISISFIKITKYYDNRDAVVTSTADDWADYCDHKFVISCQEFRKRGKTVVLGGVHPTILPDEALQHADSVVVGEADE